jgi:hypothetical protein
MQFGRWQFIKEMRNSLFVWCLSIAWSSLGITSTISLIFPKIADHVPRWPWHVWVIGFLVIALIAVVEGAYAQARILYRLTNQTQLDIKAAHDAEVLRNLPEYAHDIEVDLMAVCRGVTLDLSLLDRIFLKLDIVSEHDTAILAAKFAVQIRGAKHVAERLTDLSGWCLRTEVDNPAYPYLSTQRQNLETMSLWKEIQASGLPSGIHKTGWVGLHIPDMPAVPLDSLEKVAIEMVKTHRREPYRFIFRAWPEVKGSIIDADFA